MVTAEGRYALHTFSLAELSLGTRGVNSHRELTVLVFLHEGVLGKKNLKDL